jgi:hypothetical protein
MKSFKTYIFCTLFILLAGTQASAQSIVGAWTAGNTTVDGASVLVFLANGYYFQIQNAEASEAPHGLDGFERGTYTWNPATGALTVTTVQDLNGDTGLSDLNGASGLTFTVSGNAATFTIPGEGTITANRVTGTSPIVGAWFFGNPAVADNSVVVVFLPNGVYFMAQDGDSSPVTGDPNGHDGIEHGTYSWNPTTGALTSSPPPALYVDTNGDWGLSHPSGPRTANLSADGLTLVTHEGTDSFSLARVGGVASAPANYQGLWFNPAESGWGINFAHQGDLIFASWFTYDLTGKGTWLVMTASKTAPGTYTGTLFQGTGPSFDAVPFPPLGSPGGATVSGLTGTGTIAFSDANNATFAYTLGGIPQSKTITRQLFGPQPVCTFGAQTNLALATNYTDLWWATPGGSEAGWGINLTHQGDIIFASWFTFDRDHTPMWLVVQATKTAPGVYVGTQVYRLSGPAFNAMPFPPIGAPGGPTGVIVGTATFTFADGNAASFNYTVDGATQTKSITREVFATPGTVCQ